MKTQPQRLLEEIIPKPAIRFCGCDNPPHLHSADEHKPATGDADEIAVKAAYVTSNMAIDKPASGEHPDRVPIKEFMQAQWDNKQLREELQEMCDKDLRRIKNLEELEAQLAKERAETLMLAIRADTELAAATKALQLVDEFGEALIAHNYDANSPTVRQIVETCRSVLAQVRK